MKQCFLTIIYKQIITGDESWIYAYDPETTDKTSEYRLKGEAKPKRPCQSCSKIKVMLTGILFKRYASLA